MDERLLADSTPSDGHLEFLGLGLGDRFEGFQGRSGSFEERVLHTEKPGELQGKRATKRLLGIT